MNNIPQHVTLGRACYDIADIYLTELDIWTWYSKFK